MLKLLKEAKSEFMKNPKECIQDSVMLLLIFATGYFMLMLGSILGLQ
tara:strand:+ start:254 stop:394 length:141 start_codon:yes stop_codon:yes gene_type:complete